MQSDPSVLLVGAGGIGSPCAMVLARASASGNAPPFSLTVLDDDAVEASNLHRQILFEESDVGAPKLEALARAIAGIAPSLVVRAETGRLVPDTALEHVTRARVIIDATDNFASRFLAADAAFLAGRPVIHAASVRWHATVLASRAEGAPCYRCLFEDLPSGNAPDCATAGVIGPVCGVAGALAADMALRLLAGDASPCGFVFTYDGRTDKLRRVAVGARADCALCGANRLVRDLDASRYMGDTCG